MNCYFCGKSGAMRVAEVRGLEGKHIAPACPTCHKFYVEAKHVVESALGIEAPQTKSAVSEQVGGDHYKKLTIQPAEFCQKNRLGYCESNVVKYVSRHRAKGGRKDIEKAIHYLRMLLEMEYPEDTNQQG